MAHRLIPSHDGSKVAFVRVLLIDDSRDDIWALSHLLGRAGFEVRTAETAGQAVSIAAEFRPNVICVDLSMPKIDGYQLAIGIRQIAGLEQVAIITLSGNNADPERAERAGIFAHFQKPADFRLIGVAIVEAVGATEAVHSLN